MKRLLILLICIFAFFAGKSQIPTLQQKLYYTCKVWGFVKYYHSEVSVCNVNWDSVLLRVLPLVRSATTNDDFNDALDSMLNAAGPMTLSSTYFPDTLAPALKRNRDWTWIADPLLRMDIRTILDTIKNNFRPHAICWMQNNTYTGPYQGYLIFPYDSLELNINTTTSYPDQDHRQLLFFKFWNIICYFNPYNYVLDVNWDTTLAHNVIPIDTVASAQSLFNQIEKISTALNDAHTYGLTYHYSFQTLPGFYKPYVRLQYMGGNYVVINSLVAGINRGDVIVSVDGRTPTQWEDSLKPYYSAGNLSVFRRTMCEKILGRMASGVTEAIEVQDSTGAHHTVTASAVWWLANKSFFNDWYYPADSLSSIRWTAMKCGIGYINIGNLSVPGADSAYAELRNSPAIIVDLRNYPPGLCVWELAALMYSSPMEVAKFSKPDVTYPGTYYWYHATFGTVTNPTPYSGKIIILVNEVTQSAAEYGAMILRAMPGSIVLGSQTAGADGNITYWNLTQDLGVGFTNLGVYYPNGDSTQRIGIMPDSFVYPTATGIRHHDDEVLDKALEIACSVASTPTITNIQASVRIYPSPSDAILNIIATNINFERVEIQVLDLSGRKILGYTKINTQKNFIESININELSSGLYLLRLNTKTSTWIGKFIKR
jgi:carboxyl-terminal processing protease